MAYSSIYENVVNYFFVLFGKVYLVGNLMSVHHQGDLDYCSVSSLIILVEMF